MTPDGRDWNGAVCASAKNVRDARAIARLAADTLKRTRLTERGVLTSRVDRTAASIAASTAPAAGPNSSAALNVKTSEIERVIGGSGIRSVNCALAIVSSASTAHRESGGVAIREAIDTARIAPPRIATIAWYHSPDLTPTLCRVC